MRNLLDLGLDYDDLPPDHTPNVGDATYCDAQYGPTGAMCTLRRSQQHRVHMAGDGAKIIAMWVSEEVSA